MRARWRNVRPRRYSAPCDAQREAPLARTLAPAREDAGRALMRRGGARWPGSAASGRPAGLMRDRVTGDERQTPHHGFGQWRRTGPTTVAERDASSAAPPVATRKDALSTWSGRSGGRTVGCGGSACLVNPDGQAGPATHGRRFVSRETGERGGRSQLVAHASASFHVKRTATNQDRLVPTHAWITFGRTAVARWCPRPASLHVKSHGATVVMTRTGPPAEWTVTHHRVQPHKRQ